MDSRISYYQNFCKNKIFNANFSCRVGKRLKSIRLKQDPKITQQDMAEIIGCNRTHISAIENGHCKLSFDEFLAYSLVLKCPMEHIFPVDYEKIEDVYLDSLPKTSSAEESSDRFSTFGDQ